MPSWKIQRSKEVPIVSVGYNTFTVSAGILFETVNRNRLWFGINDPEFPQMCINSFLLRDRAFESSTRNLHDEVEGPSEPATVLESKDAEKN